MIITALNTHRLSSRPQFAAKRSDPPRLIPFVLPSPGVMQKDINQAWALECENIFPNLFHGRQRRLLNQFAPKVNIDNHGQYPFAYNGKIKVNPKLFETASDELFNGLGIAPIYADMATLQEGLSHETRHHAEFLAADLIAQHESQEGRKKRLKQEQALIPWAIDWQLLPMKQLLTRLANPNPADNMLNCDPLKCHPNLAKLKTLAQKNNPLNGLGKEMLQHQIALHLATQDTPLLPALSPVYIFSPSETSAWRRGIQAWTTPALRKIVPRGVRHKLGLEGQKRIAFLNSAQQFYRDLQALLRGQQLGQKLSGLEGSARSSYQRVKATAQDTNSDLFKNATAKLPQFLAPELHKVLD